VFNSRYERYELEPLLRSRRDFVKEITYQAIYVAPALPPPGRDILKSPEIKKYYEHWGKKGDIGLVLVHYPSEQPVGGAFVRLYPKDKAGYGFVSEKIPELNIALLPDHRGKGQGSRLLTALLDELRKAGFPGVSLSVDRQNPAMKLYEKLGFVVVKEEGNPTMLLQFS